MKKNDTLEQIIENFVPIKKKPLKLVIPELRQSTNEEKDKDTTPTNIPDYLN